MKTIKGSDSMASALAQEKHYTIEDIYNLPEGSRAELIDGRIYDMALPSTNHQRILSFLHLEIGNYLRTKKGTCEVFPAPFAVFLFADDSKYLEPDISVICDTDKLNEHGCNGAPDWVIEIVSPSNPGHDYILKLNLYARAGVREYWIVDPIAQTIFVYHLEEHHFKAMAYTFRDNVKASIFDDLYIDFSHIPGFSNN